MNRSLLRQQIFSSSDDSSSSSSSSDSSDSDDKLLIPPVPKSKHGAPKESPPETRDLLDVDFEKELKKTTYKSGVVAPTDSLFEDHEPVNYYKKTPNLIRMSLVRRRIVSGCQWASNLLLYVMGILAFIDILIAPTANANYIYLSAQEASDAGFLGFHGSIYSEWVYFVFECVSFGLMCLAFFLELRCYRLRMMGCDLKWDVFPISMIDDQFVIESIQQARNSLSPFGAAYDNYVYFLLFHVMLFILLFFHIFIESWNILFFAVMFVVLSIWSIVIVVMYMHKTFFGSKYEFERYRTLKEKFEELVKQREKELEDIKQQAITDYLEGKIERATKSFPPLPLSKSSIV